MTSAARVAEVILGLATLGDYGRHVGVSSSKRELPLLDS